MIESTSEDAELERQIEARVAARRSERLGRFDPTALAWMVLVPSWTEELARACDFPANVAELFPELHRAGLCEQSKRVFWMADAEREQARSFLLGLFSRQIFDEHAERIARGLLRRASDPRPPLAPPLVRWATLAGCGHEGPAQLRTRVREALDSGEAGDALGWLESARYLDGLVTARYGAEIALSQRRIELVYRLGQDRRHLESFLERPEQKAAIDRLLAPDSPCWALHLLGMGGVGKTMLLRHVTVTQADSGRSIVARVDFDHLNPDFPVRRPGQLLSALADELASQLDGGRQQSLLISFHGYIAEINEQLSAEPPPDDPLGNLKHPLFARILGAFADLLRSLPRPPLFILDTCEELAKIDPVSATIPGVEAMFYMLELLQVLVPELRVLLAGRRLLAQGGAGWTVDPERLSHEARRLPEPRDYLALHMLRGFTADEVDAYLAAQQVTLTADARAALLAQCPDAGGLPGVASSNDPDDAPRYNPFDVALYAGWLQSDPDLDLARIARFDTDPYVELRILRRLESDDLRDAMPALTLLRRFDRGALGLLFPGDPDRIDRLYRMLGEQEWTDYQADGSGGALEISRALLPRIAAYFEHPTRRSALDAASRKLAPALASALRATRLEDCRIETIDAALRTAPAVEGAALWADLERRIALGRAFSWAVRVAGRLLGEGAAGAPEGPLRVAIQATHTSAITHEQPALDLRAAWEEIDKGALKYAEDAQMRSLHVRAVAGQIAAARVTRKAPSQAQTDELIGLLEEPLPEDEFLADQRLAAFAAAIDAALDAGAKLSIESLAPLFDRHRRARPLLAAFLTLLDARVSVATGSPERATALFQAALRLAIANHAESDASGYLDWTPPGHLADRVRLEYERSVVAPQRTDAELRAELVDAATRLRGIDAERWTAAMLLRRLASGLVPGDIVDDVLQHERYEAARVAVCEAHRATPRLLVVAAHAIAAAGDPTRALALLEARLDAATTDGHDKPTIVAVQRAKLAVMQRYRIDPGSFALRLLDDPDEHLRFAAGSALMFTGAAEINELISNDPAIAAPWLGLGGAPEDIESRLQLRALAERALLDAERLALGDPARGARRLLDASGAFLQGNDAVGALIAAIAAALTSARSGVGSDEARAAHSAVTLGYPEARSVLGEGLLPGYEALRDSGLADAVAMIETAPAGWREWLFRLIVCLYVDDARLEAVISGRYGARIPGELRLSALPDAVKEPTLVKVPPTSWHQRWVINGILGIIVLFGVGGSLKAADWAQRLLVKYTNWNVSASLLLIAVGVAYSLLIGSKRKDNRWIAWTLIRGLFFDLPRALLFTRGAAIHIEASMQGSLPLALRIERSTRFRAFPGGEPAVETWTGDIALPASADTYAVVSTGLPEKVIEGIQSLERGFVVHRHVPIVARRNESMLPWEAYVRQALPPTRTTTALWLYRPVSAPKPSSEARLTALPGRVKLPHDIKERWMEELWSAYHEIVDATPSIVHAVGVPVRMSRGIRLKIGDEELMDTTRAKVLYPENLCILQLPVVDSTVRAETDRQQVADLRELAFDTVRSGTPFVLVLPALMKEDAVLLITELAKRLGRKQPTLDSLLSITEELRSLLLRPKDPHAAELRELAYDITLFAAETGPLGGGKTTK